MISNLLQSIRLLADGMRSFEKNCVVGIEPNKERIHQLLNESLMLATILNSRLGYDSQCFLKFFALWRVLRPAWLWTFRTDVAKCAKKAHKEGTTLKAATVSLGLLNETEFDEIVRPELMLGPESQLWVISKTATHQINPKGEVVSNMYSLYSWDHHALCNKKHFFCRKEFLSCYSFFLVKFLIVNGITMICDYCYADRYFFQQSCLVWHHTPISAFVVVWQECWMAASEWP